MRQYYLVSLKHLEWKATVQVQGALLDVSSDKLGRSPHSTSLSVCKFLSQINNLSQRVKVTGIKFKSLPERRVLSTFNFMKWQKTRWCSSLSQKLLGCVKIKLCPRCPRILHTWVSRLQIERTQNHLRKNQAYLAKENLLATNILSFRKPSRTSLSPGLPKKGNLRPLLRSGNNRLRVKKLLK